MGAKLKRKAVWLNEESDSEKSQSAMQPIKEEEDSDGEEHEPAFDSRASTKRNKNGSLSAKSTMSPFEKLAASGRREVTKAWVVEILEAIEEHYAEHGNVKKLPYNAAKDVTGLLPLVKDPKAQFEWRNGQVRSIADLRGWGLAACLCELLGTVQNKCCDTCFGKDGRVPTWEDSKSAVGWFGKCKRLPGRFYNRCNNCLTTHRDEVCDFNTKVFVKINKPRAADQATAAKQRKGADTVRHAEMNRMPGNEDSASSLDRGQQVDISNAGRLLEHIANIERHTEAIDELLTMEDMDKKKAKVVMALSRLQGVGRVLEAMGTN
ncbi:uncharacterized protein LTR77_003932 [Saxophila tyrrhenica]|uniref:Uncharacterized protein n=1 Tax=Saxophila tyrrhenica TaxID=1690608 RepID=A0AAV9PFR4_9PEZI|nr:hypothetical protein LTR77_003932 [Saxophila tyrrhenica]